jgi:transcriptional regulator with XRE-family HTH domain
LIVLRPSAIRVRVLALARKLVEQRQLSVSELALHAGISQPHMSNILHGNRAAGERQLEAIMDALAVGPEDVLTAGELAALASWAGHLRNHPERKRALPRSGGAGDRVPRFRPLRWYSGDAHIRARQANETDRWADDVTD